MTAISGEDQTKEPYCAQLPTLAGRKTESEMPGSPRHQEEDTTKGRKYHLHGQDLKTTETMKYLGVTISQRDRSWDTHITNVTVTTEQS